MKKKKKVNNLTFIILGAVVLFVVGGLIGSSITGNAVKGQGWLGGLFGG